MEISALNAEPRDFRPKPRLCVKPGELELTTLLAVCLVTNLVLHITVILEATDEQFCW